MRILADLREQYSMAEFGERNALADPFEQFRVWFEETQREGLIEANAMCLATADASGRPDARMVLLKGIDSGFVFYTNLESAKAKDLAVNPRAALCFYWKELERQVRIRGVVESVDRGSADEYFHSRPRGSQLGAWLSRQSTVIANRDELERKCREAELEFEGREVPLPDDWGGYRLVPDELEFWQGRRDRLHDRLLYRREGDRWIRERLSP